MLITLPRFGNHRFFLLLLQVVIGALMKLAGGSPSFANELNVDAFLQQVGLFLVARVFNRVCVVLFQVGVQEGLPDSKPQLIAHAL